MVENNDIRIESRPSHIDWEKLSELYRSVDWQKPATELELVFRNSQHSVVAKRANQYVGVARAFSDGLECAVVCDVVICPEEQGTGLGRRVMKRLLEDLGPYRRVMLFCTIGTEPFYESLGFGKMTTGMCIFQNQQKAIADGYIAS